jgi:hypothetical protein
MAHAPYSDGTLYWDCANSTSGSGRLSVSFTKSLNWETLVFYSGARGREVWRNGIRIASSTTTTAPVVGNTANVPLYIGASSSATLTAGDNDDVALFVVSSGKDWTAGEIINWSRDPYGSTFEPRLFVVPAVVASSYTHPTLSAVTATEITATSFKPRVTYTF